MKVVNEFLMNAFRAAPNCEWCRRRIFHGKADAHHLFGRGFGGGHRLDVALNLLSLCRLCHTEFHDGQIARSDLLAVVAAREKCLQPDLERALYFLIALPKDLSPERLEDKLVEIGLAARVLVERSLEEAGLAAW